MVLRRSINRYFPNLVGIHGGWKGRNFGPISYNQQAQLCVSMFKRGAREQSHPGGSAEWGRSHPSIRALAAKT
jgi:hypothetical protein